MPAFSSLLFFSFSWIKHTHAVVVAVGNSTVVERKGEGGRVRGMRLCICMYVCMYEVSSLESGNINIKYPYPLGRHTCIYVWGIRIKGFISWVGLERAGRKSRPSLRR